MGLGCGMYLCKYILFFFNFLIFLCGTAILALGIWLVADKSSVMALLKVSQQASENADVANVSQDTVLEQLAYIFIAIGVIVMVLGFFGCCGAAQESVGCLTVYVVLVMLMILLEIGGGIYAGVAKEDFKVRLKEIAKTSLTYYKDEKSTDALTLAWNYVFAEFECCGIDSAYDLRSSKWWTEKPSTQGQPVACCILKGEKSKFEPLDAKCPLTSYTEADKATSNAHKGCYEPVQQWFDDNFQIVIGLAVGVCLIEFFGVMIACCICCALKQLSKEF